MTQRLVLTSVVVRDYDEAIKFFVEQLGFELKCDEELSNSKRWVVVAPAGASDGGILLAKATSDRQVNAVGNQTGGRVFLFLQTDDFERDYRNYLAKGVRFLEAPRMENYGTVAVFEDLYGNKWDLIGTKKP